MGDNMTNSIDGRLCTYEHLARALMFITFYQVSPLPTYEMQHYVHPSRSHTVHLPRNVNIAS